MIIDKIKNLFTGDNNLYCMSSLPSVVEFGEIISVKKQQPSWWKKLPTKIENYIPYPGLMYHKEEFKNFKTDILTVKHCPAISENVNTGILIKAWCDITIFINPDGIIDSSQANEEVRAQRPSGSTHPYNQRAGFLPNMAHYKIHSPWIFNTKKYRKFYFQGAYMWNSSLVENNIFIVPGFIDYYTQAGTEINLFAPIKKESYAIEIKHGDPLVHLFPIDSNPVNVVPKLLDKTIFQQQQNIHPKFVGSFKLFKSRNKK